jgi:hypothetical protein
MKLPLKDSAPLQDSAIVRRQFLAVSTGPLAA